LDFARLDPTRWETIPQILAQVVVLGTTALKKELNFQSLVPPDIFARALGLQMPAEYVKQVHSLLEARRLLRALPVLLASTARALGLLL
jgi:hypothetical protein